MSNTTEKPDFKPKVAGLYFARRHDSDAWYFYLVHVVGEAPFLRVEQAMDLKEYRPVPRGDYCMFVWGPKIETPEIPDAEIKKVNVY